jgi:hypothetical protein
MDDSTPTDQSKTELEAGGLRFTVAFRGPGATLRVFGPVEGSERELLRFDDFVEGPHYHVPADGDQIEFDRSRLGDPLDFYVSQLRDHLDELLTKGGFEQTLAGIDVGAVSEHAEEIRGMMIDCVPEGYTRVPGVGLQKAG